MTLLFAPQTEEELLDLMPDGEYEFYVKEANRHINPRNGNTSIKLNLGIIDHHGREKELVCYLSINYIFLLKHFCDATGLEEVYKTGKLDIGHCLKQSGKCVVGREEPAPGTRFRTKNVILDFVKRDAAFQAAPLTEEFINDPIPF